MSMPLIYTIRRVLLEAEEKVSHCDSHYQLVKGIRATERELDQFLDQIGDVSYQPLQNQLASLTTAFPAECRLCSEAALAIFALEDEIRRESEGTTLSGSSEVKLPSANILYSRIINTYPFPIARSYSHISEAEDIKDRIERLIDSFDFSYRYCAYLLLAFVSLEEEGREPNLLRDIWKSMARPNLGFKAGIGGAIKKIGSNFDLSHPFFRSLFLKLEDSQQDIQQLVGLRDRVKHETGGYSSDSSSEDFVETQKEAEESLKKLLWRIDCLTQARLIYPRKPLNFLEKSGQMEYEIADCMGASDTFAIKKTAFPKESLHRNRRACLWLKGDEEKGTRDILLSLYPLLITFPVAPRDQVYIYHDYDSEKNQFVFVHPFHKKRLIGGNEDSFVDLERKIRHGMLKDE